MLTVAIIFIIYLVQAVTCAVIHVYRATRIPHSNLEFMKMIFLPWVIYMIYYKKDPLK